MEKITEVKSETEPKWYVIHTYSTYELAVRDNILKMVENTGLQDQIFDVVVPQEEEVVETKTKRKTVLRKKFPTYVFIKMINNAHNYYMVTRIHGVTGFVGAGGKPEALTPEEVRRNRLEKVNAEDLGLQDFNPVPVRTLKSAPEHARAPLVNIVKKRDRDLHVDADQFVFALQEQRHRILRGQHNGEATPKIAFSHHQLNALPCPV